MRREKWYNQIPGRSKETRFYNRFNFFTMGSYTAEQLRGAGTPTEALSGVKTFTLNNPSTGSAYFTIETINVNPGSFEGKISSPYPALGPEPKNLISLAIFIKHTAVVFNVPEKFTISS